VRGDRLIGDTAHLLDHRVLLFIQSVHGSSLSALPLFVTLCLPIRSRRVDRDDDGEGEHDRRDHPPGEEQQGHYLGRQLDLLRMGSTPLR
jgi:hypothetical protein